MEPGYVALRRLRFGEGYIEPGEPVPHEEGRNYASLLSLGHIAEVKPAESMSDAELAEEVERLRTENEALQAQVGGGSAPVEVPEDVTPGITQGWPLDAVTGDPLALTDEQRSALAEELPEGTEETPVSAIVTHDGHLVVISGGTEEEQEAAPAESSGEQEGSTEEAQSAAEESEATDLASLKRPELDALATKLGIENPEGIKNAGLVKDAIRAKLAESSGEQEG